MSHMNLVHGLARYQSPCSSIVTHATGVRWLWTLIGDPGLFSSLTLVTNEKSEISGSSGDGCNSNTGKC